MVKHFRKSGSSVTVCGRLNIDDLHLVDDPALVTCKSCLRVKSDLRTIHLRKSDKSIACGKLKLIDPVLTDDPRSVTCQRCISVINGGSSGGRKKLDLDSKLVRVGFYEGDLDWAENQTSSLSELIRNAVRFYRKYQTGETMTQTDQNNKIVIAVTSSSGGTGKTTTCRNLGAEFARKGKRVLLIDIDPQSNLDLFCGLVGVDPHPDGDVTNIFAEDFDGRWPISSIEGESLELVRGNRKMIQLQGELSHRRNRERILARALKTVPDCYEIIIIDCPATGGYLVDNALVAATHVLAPILLEEKSIQGIGGLLSSLPKLAYDLEINPPHFLGIVPSICSRSVTVTARNCREGLEAFAERLEFEILPGISEYEDIKKAHGQGCAIGRFRPGHPAAKEFQVLTNRVEQLIEAHHGKI
jgi:chromosome partitioning protein